MQLRNKSKNIKTSLALATAALLGHSQHDVQAADTTAPWEVDTAVMSYEETGRVRAIEPVLRMRKDKGNDEFFTFRLVLDTLTGASPNGAIPTSSAQTFSGPSGTSSYSTPANTVPLDPNFHDNRIAISGEWEQPFGTASRSVYGLNLSTETDYTSFGASATYNFDYNNRNTTYTLGVSVNADAVKPIGGKPTGLAYVPAPGSGGGGGGGGEDDDGGGDGPGAIGFSFDVNKHVYDLLLGVTQVMSRKDLIQVNFNYGQEDGYLNDPYKLLSVVDNNGVLLASPNSYVYEKRPDTRSRSAVFARWSHQFTQDVLRVSYRAYSDDWGIRSNTIDTHYRFELGERHFLEPHYRYYKQDAADFYHTSLRSSELASTNYASADYRLADLTTKTVGLKYGALVGKHSELGLRFERITQKATPSVVIGVQNQQELLPEIQARIIQLSYSYLW